MSQAPVDPRSPAVPEARAVDASGLLRVSVTSGRRRVDLVLPGAVAVADLVPELARSVGVLDPLTAHAGYRLITAEGRVLGGGTGLAAQGVADGSVLTVAAGIDDRPPRVYDDVVEAMTDVVERDLAPWTPQAGRRTALVASGVLLALGLGALLVQRGSLLAAAASAVVAVALLAAGVVLSRAQDEPEVGVAVAFAAAAYGGVAGLLFTDGLAGLPLIAAGGGAAGVAVIGLLGLDEKRALVLPGAVAGVVIAVCGAITRQDWFEVSSVTTVALAIVVLIGSLAPWFALRVTGTDVEQWYSVADITADPDEIDPRELGADARLAHDLLVGLSGAVGLVLVLLAPVAVQRGLAGALLAVAASVVVMLRTRQYRTRATVLVGLGSGLAGLAATAITVVVAQPDWRPTAAVVLAAAGSVLLVLTLVPQTPSVRQGRAGDIAETICLLALLPLTVVASGLFAAVSG